MTRRTISRVLMTLAILAAPDFLLGVTSAANSASSEPAKAVFARVNGSVISVELYETELNLAIRNKFYHRRPPQGQLEVVQREVADALIERVLLLEEARRRGIKADPAKTEETVRAFEKRYVGNKDWQVRRDELLPLVRSGAEDRDVLGQLERKVREVREPSPGQVRAYYDANHDQFTEPERLRLSAILLKVDPAATQEELDKAMAKAQRIRKQLSSGADFAKLAREHSNDESAKNGGDMGYLHRGMLPVELHAQVEKLAPGKLSEPIRVLQGMAIVRLEERQPPRLRSFEDSSEAAAKLWKRERAETQWKELKEKLRKGARIEIVDRDRYPRRPSSGK